VRSTSSIATVLWIRRRVVVAMASVVVGTTEEVAAALADELAFVFEETT
jgi:hypothetical protein